MLIYDLINHGDKSLFQESAERHAPVDDHWYAPVKRYVSARSKLRRGVIEPEAVGLGD